MISRLLLQTGGDVPFPDARITVHNPKLKEIAFIGESSFHPGCQFLNFSKESIENEGNFNLEEKTDFDIFMSIICDKERAKFKNDAKMVMSLLFPDCMISYDETKGIELTKPDGFKTSINRYNYDTFKEIINSLFCLQELEGKNSYKPADGLAKKIAEKLKKRASKKNGGNEEMKEINIFDRYISILAVGQKKNVNDFNDYTVYQLLDEFTRYQKKESYDMYISAKMAGAQNLEDVDNWMEDIHS